VIAAAVLGYAIFNFSGRNLRFFLHMNSGASNLEKGRLIYAVSDFNSALNIKPDSPVAIDALGSVYVKQGDFEKAKQTFLSAAAAGLKNNRYINHTKLGSTYLDNGLYKRAELEFLQAIKINPVDFRAFYGLGCCLHAFGKIDSAIANYNKALTYNPRFDPAKKNLQMAEADKNRGAIYYMFDRNGQPLARLNLISGIENKSYALDFRAAHVTGYDSEKRGKAGMEKYLEEYIPGNRIYLTIDSKAQQASARALGWYKGSVVIIHPKTGEILAMYSQPTYRAASIDKEWRKIASNENKPLLNRAIDRLYEPGSIAKLMTIAAFYESGISESSIFPINCRGNTELSDKTFWCWSKHGRVRSIEQATDTSCNIASAFMGFAASGPKLIEYCTRFGFGTPIDLGIKDGPRNRKISIPVLTSRAPSYHFDRYDVAMHASGLAPSKKEPYLITPLHAAMLASSIANNGVMMKPYIIQEIRNINGKLIYSASPKEFKKPISASTAEKIKQLMIKVVDSGIGKRARVKGISIAGKTGTSSGDRPGLHHGWFISFGPTENPEYALAIVADNEGKGMTTAAPVAADIYTALLR